MKTTIIKRGLKAIALLPVLIAFQNCSPSFHAIDGSSNGESLASTDTPPVDPLPIETQEKVITASETQPIAMTIDSREVLTPNALPSGAMYNASTGIFRWLPKTGQAGPQTVDFKTSSGAIAFRLKLQINSLGPTALATGPTDGSQDGDVGFVFIHGLGEVDRCADSADLAAYWGSSPTVIGRSSKSTVLCYDGRSSVETVAPQIARKILDSDCGRYNRCVLVTHSMGGLVAEFIMTHARAAKSTDPEPGLFANAVLFAQVKTRTLSIISLASAAGGSKVADMATNAPSTTFSTIISQVTNWMGRETDSVRSVVVSRATTVLAPINEDPEVPVYMVPGFSSVTAWEWDKYTGGLYGTLFGSIPANVFQSEPSLTALDGVMQTTARFDGLVDFRSACGNRSGNSGDGPGYGASVATQLLYCAQAAKKPNHFVWFASNLNHYWIATDWAACSNPQSPCLNYEMNQTTQTLNLNANRNGMSAVRVARAKIDENRRAEVSAVVNYSNGTLSSGLLGSL